MGYDERLSMLQGRSGETAVFSKRQSLQGMKTEWEEGHMLGRRSQTDEL